MGLPISFSYSRRHGDYLYDIAIYEPPQARQIRGRFYAQVLNMVRLESGEKVSVEPAFQDAYGRTPGEAFSRIEAAVKAWVAVQT
jgi:hypothetical protein